MLRLPLTTAVRRQWIRSFTRTAVSNNQGSSQTAPPDTILASISGVSSTSTTPAADAPPVSRLQFDDNSHRTEFDSLDPKVRQDKSLPKSQRKKSHALPNFNIQYYLHVQSTNNNTILTFTDQEHNPRACVSAGLCGFKKVQRSTYEAGYQCAVRVFKRIEEEIVSVPSMKLEVIFKGFGQGREAVFRALVASEGEKIRDHVNRMKDVTPIKIGGPKAKKTRRL